MKDEMTLKQFFRLNISKTEMRDMPSLNCLKQLHKELLIQVKQAEIDTVIPYLKKTLPAAYCSYQAYGNKFLKNNKTCFETEWLDDSSMHQVHQKALNNLNNQFIAEYEFEITNFNYRTKNLIGGYANKIYMGLMNSYDYVLKEILEKIQLLFLSLSKLPQARLEQISEMKEILDIAKTIKIASKPNFFKAIETDDASKLALNKLLSKKDALLGELENLNRLILEKQTGLHPK